MAWSKLGKALMDHGATAEVIAEVKRLERESKEHGMARNYIAHAGCVGTLAADPEYLVFAPFESHDDDHMLMRLISLRTIHTSAEWACAAAEMIFRLMRSAGH